MNQVEKGKQPATIIDLCNNSPVVQSQPYDPASSPTVHQLRSDVIDLTSDPDTPSGSSQMAIPSSLPTVITDASDDIVDTKDQDMTCDSDIESEAPSDSEEEDVDVGDLDESSDDDMASVMDPMSPVDDESNMDSDIDSTSIASNEYEYDEEQDDETDTYGFLSGKSSWSLHPLLISNILIQLYIQMLLTYLATRTRTPFVLVARMMGTRPMKVLSRTIKSLHLTRHVRLLRMC